MRCLLIPLDDRPPGLQFPKRLASIAGIELITPPRDLLGRFLIPGRTDELRRWLEHQAALADAAIIAVDMLCFGGLVASRTLDVSASTALDRLSSLRTIRHLYPRLQIFAFSIITRLTITAADPESAAASPHLFSYCQQLEAARAGDLPAIEACRRLEKELHSGLADRFLAVRDRNHQVNLGSVLLLAEGVIDFLLLPQEDAAPRGIHRIEQANLLERAVDLGVADRAIIYPGADEAAMTLVARAVGELLGYRPALRAEIWPASAGATIPEYEDRPLSESLALQFQAAKIDDPESAARPMAELIVWAGSGQGADPGPLLERVAGTVDGVGLVDVARANGADPMLMERLDSLPGRVLSRLSSYAGWNTAGNSLGTAIAHLSCLQLRAGSDSAGLKPLAHYRFLFERLVDDWLYQSMVRPQLNAELRAAGILPENLGMHSPAVQRTVEERLVPLALDLFDRQFRGIPCLEGTLTDLSSLTVRLPWGRTFEIEFAARSGGGLLGQ